MNTTKNSSLLFYLYNEHLPIHKAHDVYVYQTCEALGKLGFSVSLYIGSGSDSKEKLSQHYLGTQKTHFSICPLFHLRKNRNLPLSWNLPFFYLSQKAIEKKRPLFVMMSVRKQARYHLKRKVSGVNYIYEVHELAYYPGKELTAAFREEKELLSHVDLITVTTNPLKEILLSPPYNIKTPIHVVDLAVKRKALNLPPLELPLQILYVGQLYKEQGVQKFIEALSDDIPCILHVVGGTHEEQNALKKQSQGKRVVVHGFIPPSEIEKIAQKAHLCIAPFELTGRMPFVAHTKLCEYAMWKRPFIAPKCPLVSEHFPKGALTFQSQQELKEILQSICSPQNFSKLYTDLKEASYDFSWERRAQCYQELLSKREFQSIRKK